MNDFNASVAAEYSIEIGRRFEAAKTRTHYDDAFHHQTNLPRCRIRATLRVGAATTRCQPQVRHQAALRACSSSQTAGLYRSASS
jgi:hypothetical protein